MPNLFPYFSIYINFKGASSSWWNFRHNLHHSKPNIIKTDPDINFPYLFLLGSKMPIEWAKKRRGFMPYSHQHKYFFLRKIIGWKKLIIIWCFFSSWPTDFVAVLFSLWEYVLHFEKTENPSNCCHWLSYFGWCQCRIWLWRYRFWPSFSFFTGHFLIRGSQSLASIWCQGSILWFDIKHDCFNESNFIIYNCLIIDLLRLCLKIIDLDSLSLFGLQWSLKCRIYQWKLIVIMIWIG